jgi:hypothetical protein
VKEVRFVTNSFELEVILVTERGRTPALEMFKVNSFELPALTKSKFRIVSATTIFGLGVCPLSETVVVNRFGSFELMLSLADLTPVEDGKKVIVTFWLESLATVKTVGEIMKSVELEVISDTDKGAVPGLNTIKVKLLELPTSM